MAWPECQKAGAGSAITDQLQENDKKLGEETAVMLSVKGK